MNKSRTTLVILFVLAIHGALWAEDKQAPAAAEEMFQPNVFTIGRWSDVSGDEAKFREHFQKQTPFSGGLEKLLWSGEGKDGFKFELEGRALYDSDYGLNLKLAKKDVGVIRFTADSYRRFYDSTVNFYSYFPNIYDVGRDLYTDRSLFGVEASLALPDVPKFTFGYERKLKDGSQNLPWGGWLRDSPGNDWIIWAYPLFRDLDYESDLVYFAIEHTIAGFHVRLRQQWEKFDGTERHVEPGFLITGTQVFNRFYDNFLDHETWTTRVDVTKDLIEKKLTLDLGYTYQNVDNDNNYDTDARTPAGAIHYGEHSINFNNNTHDGSLDRHGGKVNLTWVVSDDLTFFGGIKFRRGSADNNSRRNEEGSGATAGDNDTSTSEEMWTFRTSTHEETWAESLCVTFSRIPKTRLTVGADFEQSNVDYDWNAAIVTAGLPGESVTGQGDWLWDAETEYRKYNFWFNLRTHLSQSLTANFKYRYKLVRAGVGETADIASQKPGDPEYEPTATTNMFYPGRIEGWRRPTHETRLTLDIKPSARVTLRPVVEYEFTEYKFKDQIDGAQEIADFTRIGYGASVDILLASETVWTLNYMRQDITTETLANTKTSSAGVNPFTGAPNAGYLGALIQKFDASYDTLSSVLTHTWKKLTLGVNAGLTNGEGNWDTHYYWAGLGADYRISRNVSANAGYTYYRYYEDNNGGVNNYFANALQLGMRVRF